MIIILAVTRTEEEKWMIKKKEKRIFPSNLKIEKIPKK
jgi:hypothetical protein